MKHKAENYFGWYGVFAILLAYFLVSFNVVPANSVGFQLLNLTGSFGIMVEAWSKKDVQPVVLNAVWASIAVLAIAHIAL